VNLPYHFPDPSAFNENCSVAMADNPRVSVELLEAALTTVADVLAQRQVQYAVIGGMAAGSRGLRKTSIFCCMCRSWHYA
jgi:hypothetical protein